MSTECAKTNQAPLRRRRFRRGPWIALIAISLILGALSYVGAEEGKTPMAVAAEDMVVSYKVEAVFREAEQLRRKRGVKPVCEEDIQDESQSRRNSDKG